MNKFFVVALLALSKICFAQITAGPMLGHITTMDAKIWVQVANDDIIYCYYYPYDSMKFKATIKRELYIKPTAENWFTAEFHLQNLNPNTKYKYHIEQKSGGVAGWFTTLPDLNKADLPEIRFAFGSCTYINEEKSNPKEFGEPLVPIIQSIKRENPNFMLWLGDNVYLRKGDWNSKTGIYNRYTNFKSRAELKEFWKMMPHYAIWDDHDFGPNDADRSFINKDLTLQAFKDFWANPSYGINNKPGITTSFVYQDLEFFLLDNRYYRSPNERKTGEREILGKEQIEWLIDALVNSKANFKFVVVGGQVLSDAAVYENHATYPEERNFLLELIEKEEIKNIVFLTGDRHKTELSELQFKNGTTLYDFTSSPLASRAFDSENEGNNNQVKGTHVATQNFGTISVSGDYKNRKLVLKTFDAKGTLLWEREIPKQ